MNTLKMIVEMKTKSLKKLGDEKALDALVDFPIESLRLFFNELEKNNLKIKKQSKTDNLKRYIDSLSSSLSPTNPFFSSNYNEISIELENGKNLDLTMNIKGNSLIWGFTYELVNVKFDTMQPIKLTGKSLNEVYNTIIKKIIDATKLKYKNIDDWDNAKKYSLSLKEKEPKIYEVLKRIAERYNFVIYHRKKRSKFYQDEFEIHYKLFNEVKNYSYKITDLISDYTNEIEYKFQVEELKKISKLIINRSIANNYFIKRMDMLAKNEYLYLEMIYDENSGKSKKNNSNYTLLEIHNSVTKKFIEYIDNWQFKENQLIEKDDALKNIIKKVFK